MDCEKQYEAPQKVSCSFHLAALLNGSLNAGKRNMSNIQTDYKGTYKLKIMLHLQADKFQYQNYEKFRGAIRKIEQVGNENLYLTNKLLTTQGYADVGRDNSVSITSLQS